MKEPLEFPAQSNPFLLLLTFIVDHIPLAKHRVQFLLFMHGVIDEDHEAIAAQKDSYSRR